MPEIMKSLSDSLGLPPLMEEEKPVAEIVPYAETDRIEEAEDDFQLVRANLRSIADKGAEAFDDLLALAKASEHPRAFEVVATMMTALSNANKDMIDIRKKKIDIDKSYGVAKQELTPVGGGVTNNNVFVGSTKDLQDFITNLERKKSDIIDVSPTILHE